MSRGITQLIIFATKAPASLDEWRLKCVPNHPANPTVVVPIVGVQLIVNSPAIHSLAGGVFVIDV